MLDPGLAIGWALWRRHRWGIVLVASYLLSLIVAGFVLDFAGAGPQVVSPILGTITLGLAVIFPYLVGVFSYGFDTDLNARQSCFPAQLFRLPVRTETLALWPMVYGAAAVSLVWLTAAWFVLRPWLEAFDREVALWWPAMVAVAALAWIQAVLWMPFGLPGIRILLAIVLVTGLTVATNVEVTSEVSEASLVGLYALCSAVAWTIAYVGVRQARHGGVPNWTWLWRPLHKMARLLPSRRQPFASMARAQVWFEWRRTGRGVPVMTALVLPFALWPLLLGKNDAISPAQTLLGAMAFPLLLAGLAGTTASGGNPWVKDYYGVAPFNATLPMTTAAFVGSKLKAAALSTLATWTVLAGMSAMALAVTGTLDEAKGWWWQGVHKFGALKLAAGLVAATIFLLVWTWKREVDSLFLGLTGRKWVIHGGLIVSMGGFVGLWMGWGLFVSHPAYQATVLAILPWLLGALILCKLAVAAWALRLAMRQKLLASRTVAVWITAWLLLAFGLFSLLAWIVPLGPVPVYYLAFAVCFIMPMVRLTLSPLAFAWNRHR